MRDKKECIVSWQRDEHGTVDDQAINRRYHKSFGICKRSITKFSIVYLSKIFCHMQPSVVYYTLLIFEEKFLSLFMNTTSRFFQFSKNFTICCRKVLQCLCASCFVSCHNCITSDITYMHMLEAKGSPLFKQELAGKRTGPVSKVLP